jgi:hypothetical protein
MCPDIAAKETTAVSVRTVTCAEIGRSFLKLKAYSNYSSAWVVLPNG